MFEKWNGSVQESNCRRRATSLLVAALLAGACGTTGSPSGPESPSAGPTSFPPGNPDGLAPYLVRDIRPGADSSMSDPYAGQFFSSHGRVLFDADDGMHGLELWETDGTAAGTRLVADICPGPCSSSILMRMRQSSAI